MYLSTLFLSKIEYGTLQAITLCNEEFLRRFSTHQYNIQNFFNLNSTKNIFRLNAYGDELMVLWDVYKEFKDEIPFDKFIVLEAMDAIRTERNQVRGDSCQSGR